MAHPNNIDFDRIIKGVMIAIYGAIEGWLKGRLKGCLRDEMALMKRITEKLSRGRRN